MAAIQTDHMEKEMLSRKIILSAGKEFVPITSGAKVRFHYKTQYYDDDNKLHVLDDSKDTNSPLDIVIGKKFKFAVWESAVITMAQGEVALFKPAKSLTAGYPYVSKTLRDMQKPGDSKRHHMCGASLHTEGLGYDDLNELMRNHRQLEFIIELLQVTQDGEYEKDTWQMDPVEKLEQTALLKQQGNALYQNKEYLAASETYRRAIGILEQLMLKEKPQDTEWNELNAKKTPILLNFIQCQLLLKEYYTVIDLCSTLLKDDADNSKALYRRGKAHAAVWNFTEAEQDLKKVATLDASLASLVGKDLKEVKEEKQKQYQLEKEIYHKASNA